MIPELELRPVLVVEMVPIRVVEIVPALVVEMVPDLVVEMVPAREVAETARTNVIVHMIDASFFIFFAPSDSKYQLFVVGFE
ncbi:MAG TPA: hypothetical protein VN843_17705, partial [Anaerolineales bacterium]|nr:hypothetical protein [Anaerolineales bacterium]